MDDAFIIQLTQELGVAELMMELAGMHFQHLSMVVNQYINIILHKKMEMAGDFYLQKIHTKDMDGYLIVQPFIVFRLIY